jgi:hypothetical protein
MAADPAPIDGCNLSKIAHADRRREISVDRPRNVHAPSNAVSALIRGEMWRSQRQNEVGRLSKADRRMTAIVLNSIQTSFLNGRMLDLTEALAQSGRGLQFNCLTGTQPGVRCPRSEKKSFTRSCDGASVILCQSVS